MLHRVAQQALRRAALSGSVRAAGAVRRAAAAAASAAHNHTRGIHNCAACRSDGKAMDFGSTAAVHVTPAAGESTPSPGMNANPLIRRRKPQEYDQFVPFGDSAAAESGVEEPKLPDRLLAHLRRVDLAVQPRAMDSAAEAELKKRVIAINQQIRALGMQPAAFYQRHMDPQDLSTNAAMDESAKRERLFRPPSTEYHPTQSARHDEVAHTGYLSSHGLDNDPNQHVFDLLGHSLPKPLPPKQPCLFCRPPRDQPPEYYELDYTNVNLLHRFLNERGMITPKKYNHNCAKHQRKVANAIKRARFIGLLSFTNLYHVPRSFVAATGPASGAGAVAAPVGAAAAADMAEQKVAANALMSTPAWSLRQTASALGHGQLKGADFKFWTAEGVDEGLLDVARRNARSQKPTPVAAAAGAARKRDPNSLE